MENLDIEKIITDFKIDSIVWKQLWSRLDGETKKDFKIDSIVWKPETFNHP